MARTIRTKVYKFNELSEAAQCKAIELFSDINVNYEWWENIYADAEIAGLKITSFCIWGGSYCNGKFIISANEVAANIFLNHGNQCETHKTATSFMAEWEPVFSEYMDENSDNYESGESENKMIELEDDFLKSICEDYRIILSNEYEYLTSEDAIKETIVSNEYEFTADGRQF